MYIHDFQKGDNVCTLADPSFERPLKVLEGTVVGKWTSPRGDEHTYDIRHGNGIVYSNIPGIFVYASLADLYDATTHDLEIAVESAYREIRQRSEQLAKAEHDKERLLQMVLECRRLLQEHAADKQQDDKPPLLLSEDAIREMDTWKGFGPRGPCPRCGSKYYNRANSQTAWWVCCDCGFSYKESDK